MLQVSAVIFDACGALLDVHAAMSRHAARLGPSWQAISADWRTKQIEYTSVRSLAGATYHRSFWHLTKEALARTAARHGVTDSVLLTDVLQAYRQLDAFADAAPALTRLAMPASIRPSSRMASRVCWPTPCAPPVSSGCSMQWSEAAGMLKPDPCVYRLATERFGLPAEQMAFVSSNPWDAFGAHAFGFQVFWINCAGVLHEYGLATTATELRDLAGLADQLAL
jgi:2-haloacid dehalogenase